VTPLRSWLVIAMVAGFVYAFAVLMMGLVAQARDRAERKRQAMQRAQFELIARIGKSA